MSELQGKGLQLQLDLVDPEGMRLHAFDDLSPEEQSAIEADLLAEEGEALTPEEWANQEAEIEAERQWQWRTTSPSWR